MAGLFCKARDTVEIESPSFCARSLRVRFFPIPLCQIILKAALFESFENLLQ